MSERSRYSSPWIPALTTIIAVVMSGYIQWSETQSAIQNEAEKDRIAKNEDRIAGIMEQYFDSLAAVGVVDPVALRVNSHCNGDKNCETLNKNAIQTKCLKETTCREKRIRFVELETDRISRLKKTKALVLSFGTPDIVESFARVECSKNQQELRSNFLKLIKAVRAARRNETINENFINMLVPLKHTGGRISQSPLCNTL